MGRGRSWIGRFFADRAEGEIIPAIDSQGFSRCRRMTDRRVRLPKRQSPERTSKTGAIISLSEYTSNDARIGPVYDLHYAGNV
jgi:hypothetical protein